MTRTYDSQGADQLIPLLRSVQREMRERADLIRGLRLRIDKLAQDPDSQAALRALQAELANHKREIRLARKELERLGCAIDEERPERVLIPGDDGDLARGFAWSFGEGHVQDCNDDQPDGWGHNERAA